MKLMLAIIPILFILSCGDVASYDELVAIAKENKISEKASVKAEASIMLKVPPYIVWKRISEIKNWQKWSSTVSETTIRGDLKTGKNFTWVIDEELTSEIAVLEPMSALSIVSKGSRGDRILKWDLSSFNNIGTIIVVKESIDGRFVGWSHSSDERKIVLEQWLEDLKQSLGESSVIDF